MGATERKVQGRGFNMKVLLVLFLAMHSSSALQCYECLGVTGEGNQCDEEGLKGELKDCAATENNGCFISKLIENGHSIVTRGCTGLSNEDLYKCDRTQAGPNHAFQSCNCHGDGCNADWDSASGPSLQCYVCNSINGECDDSKSGTLQECPIFTNKGCFLSHVTYEGTSVFERGCTTVTNEADYKCEDIAKNKDQDLHYCNCHGEGCNKDWSTAGGNISQTTSVLFVLILTLSSLNLL